MDSASQAPLPNATISLKVAGQSAPLGFAATDRQGVYRLPYKTGLPVGALIMVRCLGYRPDTLSLTAGLRAQQAGVLTHQLVPLSEELPEVGVTKPISINGDTTKYHADHFSKLEDRTLEDVLKRLPGFRVESDGTIKYKDKAIKKILLDGDDLTGDGYRDISQSLHPSLLKEIQAIEHYIENPLLHGLLESDDVVVNLTFKRPVLAFGNGTLETGVPERYNGNISLLSFAPSTKSYVTASANNTGTPYSNALSPLSASPAFTIAPAVQRAVATSSAIGNNLALNHSVRGGLNSLLRLADNLKVKTNVKMLRNQLRNEQDRYGRYFVANETTITDENDGHELNRPVASELEGDYLGRDKRVTLKLNYMTQQKDFLANGYSSVNQTLSDSTAERLENKGRGFYGQAQYTQRLDSATAFLVSARMDVQELGQRYRVASPLYGSVAAFNGATQLSQQLDYTQYNHQFFATLYRKTGFRYVSVILGHEYHQSTLLAELKPLTAAPAGHSENTDNRVQNVFLSGRYGYSNRNNEYYVAASVQRYQTDVLGRDSSFFVVQPSAGFRIRMGPYASISGNYSYQNQQLANEAFYRLSILTGLRSMQTGLGAYYNFGIQQASLSYAYNDVLFSQLQANLGTTFSHSRRGLISENVFDDQIFYARNIPHLGAATWAVNGSVKKSVAGLRSILELRAGVFTNAYYAKNTEVIEKYNSLNRELTIACHTGFPIPVNFNLELQGKKQATRLRDQQVSQFDWYKLMLLTKYRVCKSVNNETTFQVYQLAGSSYYLLDNETIYRPPLSKWTFALKGKNLLDLQHLKSRAATDFSETTYLSAIRGCYVVLSASLLIQ